MFGLGEIPHRGTGATQKLQNIHKAKTFETPQSKVFSKVMCQLKEERICESEKVRATMTRKSEVNFELKAL